MSGTTSNPMGDPWDTWEQGGAPPTTATPAPASGQTVAGLSPAMLQATVSGGQGTPQGNLLAAIAAGKLSPGAAPAVNGDVGGAANVPVDATAIAQAQQKAAALRQAQQLVPPQATGGQPPFGAAGDLNGPLPVPPIPPSTPPSPQAQAPSSNPSPDIKPPAPTVGGFPASGDAGGAVTPPTVPAGSLPRGMRNNNPLNLEYKDGQGATSSDGRFGIYPTMDAGMQAAQKQLLSYQDNRGLNTVASIVNRWAPPSDNNNTSAYAATVAKTMGVGVNDQLDLHKPATLNSLSDAMARVENGPAWKGGVAPANQVTASSASAPVSGGSVGGGASTATPSPAQAQAQKLLGGGGNNGFQLPYPDAAKYAGSNSLLALAGGILQGHSFSNALGKGFESMTAAQQSDRQSQMQSNAQAMQLHQMGLMAGYRGAQLDNATTRLGQQQEAIDARLKAIEGNTSGTTKSNQLGVADNGKQVAELDSDYDTAVHNQTAANNMLANIDKAGVGPSQLDSVKRSIATSLGLDNFGGTSADAQKAMQAYLSMSQSDQAKAMKGLGLRTQNEFQTFIGGAGNLTTDPTTLRGLIAIQQSSAQRDIAAHDEFHGLPQDQQDQIMQKPYGLRDWRAQRETAAAPAIMAPQPTSGSPAAAPTASQGPSQGAPSAPPPGTVHMVSPDGKVGWIPQSQVNAATSRGFKPLGGGTQPQPSQTANPLGA